MKQELSKLVMRDLPIEYPYQKFIYDENNRPYDWETWEVESGKFIYVSPSCEKISGYTVEDFINDENLLEKIILNEDKQLWEKHMAEMEVNKGANSVQLRIKNKNGKIVWIEHTCSPLITHNGDFLGYKSNNRDITPTKESEEKYRLLFENSVETIIVIQDEKIKINNPVCERLVGYSTEELLEMPIWNLIYKEDLEEAKKIYKELIAGQVNSVKFEVRIVSKNGEVIWVACGGIQIMWNNEVAALNFAIDITERKKAEDALKASEEKYRFLTEFASDVIWVHNLSTNKITYISPAIYQLRGFTVEEAMEQTMEEMLTPKSLKDVKEFIEISKDKFIKNPENPQCHIQEIQQPCKSGEIVWVEVSTKFRYNPEGDIEVVGVSRNIDERKKTEEKIRYLSYYDQLTGLYNRTFYEEELYRIDTEENLPLTLIMADVNGLKLTNDAFGHSVGDKLLKKISEILREESNEKGIIARTGGDEFVMLMPNTPASESEKIIERIRETIDKTKMDEVILSVSFGGATKTNIDEDMENIFTEAENSMYRIKLLESRSMKSETVKLITKSLYEKDFREEEHCARVSNICRNIGMAMGLTSNEVNDLGLLGLLHDIGKIGVSEKTLNKKGKLTNAEWKDIIRHPEIGYQILRSVSEFSHIAEFVLCHHERIDGKGYPRGLKGHEIPLQAKILSVAEAYDSMINGNGYKKDATQDEVINELFTNSGTQFDGKVVRVLVDVVFGGAVG